MRPTSCILAFVLLVACFPQAAASYAATMVLDPLTQAFAPNSCLPVSDKRVVFLGEYCDGTCPPDPLVSNCPDSRQSAQIGLSSIWLDFDQIVFRITSINQNSPVTGAPAHAELHPERAEVDVFTSDPTGSMFTLSYGSESWDLNLTSLTATGMRIPVRGDISPSHPLLCNVQLVDRSAPYRYADRTVSVSGNGEFVLNFADFFTTGGFSLDQVDFINITFLDCMFGYCTAPVGPRQYSLGAIQFQVSTPTPVAKGSWGRLKTMYR